jgi:phosphinothricin acetyltransferase
MEREDWDAVSAIYAEGQETKVATFATECPGWEAFDRGHHRCCRLVAVQGRDVLGWAVLSPVSCRAVYRGVAEVSIYVAATARGRGIGKRLLSALAADAWEHGFWTLQSSVIAANEASLALHRSCGFRLVGTREKIARDRDGVWRDTCLMELRRKDDGLDAISAS